MGKPDTQKTWGWIAFAIVVAVLFGGYQLHAWLKMCPPKNAAELGDSFGVANAILSAGTVLLVVWGIVLQHRELSELREAQKAVDRRERLKAWPCFSAYCHRDPHTKGASMSVRVTNVGGIAMSIVWTAKYHKEDGTECRVQEITAPDMQAGAASTFIVTSITGMPPSGELEIRAIFQTAAGDLGETHLRSNLRLNQPAKNRFGTTEREEIYPADLKPERPA